MKKLVSFWDSLNIFVVEWKWMCITWITCIQEHNPSVSDINDITRVCPEWGYKRILTRVQQG